MAVRIFRRPRSPFYDDCNRKDHVGHYDNGISDGAAVTVARPKKEALSMEPTDVCVCEVCHKMYFVSPSDKDKTCPHCQGLRKDVGPDHVGLMDADVRSVLGPVQVDPIKSESIKSDIKPISFIDDAELSDLTGLDPADFEGVQELSVHDLKDKGWQDTRKEQISLEMGSPEYKEYLEDLAENSPDKPDDQAHAALEEHNSDLVTKGYDAEFEDNPESDPESVTDDLEDIQIQKRFAKQAVHMGILSAVMDKARTTESEVDDRVAKSIGQNNLVMTDPSVSAEDYEKELQEYVIDASF